MIIKKYAFLLLGERGVLSVRASWKCLELSNSEYFSRVPRYAALQEEMEGAKSAANFLKIHLSPYLENLRAYEACFEKGGDYDKCAY